jgi:hypothetical protein
MPAARRLAAIVAADVVGYSRLMGLDEAGTAKTTTHEGVCGFDPCGNRDVVGIVVAVTDRPVRVTPAILPCGGSQ